MTRSRSVTGVKARALSLGAPTLAPLLLGRHLGDLLVALARDPAREYTVGELAAATGVSEATVSRELSRCTDAGLVSSRRFATARLVRLALDDPTVALLRRAVVVGIHPLPALRHALARVPHLEQVWLAGEFATALDAGRALPDEGEVILVGRVDEGALEQALTVASRMTATSWQATEVDEEGLEELLCAPGGDLFPLALADPYAPSRRSSRRRAPVPRPPRPGGQAARRLSLDDIDALLGTGSDEEESLDVAPSWHGTVD